MYWENARPPFDMRVKGWHDFTYWKCTQPFKEKLSIWAKVSKDGHIDLIMEDVLDERKPFELHEFKDQQQLQDFVQIMVGLLYVVKSGGEMKQD